MDLPEVSVVMPTYRRPVYALRNMHLLDRTGARVHVLDGSPSPIDPAAMEGLSPRVNYVHLPASYEERLAHAVDLIETPFCVAVGDDDMHLPSGLAASVDALHADAELVAVMGTAIAVVTKDGKAFGKAKYEGLLNRAVVDDDPVDRMVDHLGRYLPSTVYAVTRTPVWARAVRALTGKRFRPFRLGELQYEMTVAYVGKTKVVPQLMWLRSQENRSLWLDDDLPLAPWWEQAAASGERQEFASYMGGALTDDVLKQAEAAQGALKAMDTYVEAVNELTALRARLTEAERLERWPVDRVVPLAAWGRQAAKQGIAVDEDDLAVATAAFEATSLAAALGDAPPVVSKGRGRRTMPWARRRR